MLTDTRSDSSDLPLKSVKSRRSTESTWSTEAKADEDLSYQDEQTDPKTAEMSELEDTSINTGLQCFKSDLAFETRVAACSSSSKTAETNESRDTPVADGRESVHAFETRAVAAPLPSNANTECKPADIWAEDVTKFCGVGFVEPSIPDTTCLAEFGNTSSKDGSRLLIPSSNTELLFGLSEPSSRHI